MIMLLKKTYDIVMHVFINIFFLGWGEVGGEGEVVDVILKNI